MGKIGLSLIAMIIVYIGSEPKHKSVLTRR
jgi:hypothetical protein